MGALCALFATIAVAGCSNICGNSSDDTLQMNVGSFNILGGNAKDAASRERAEIGAEIVRKHDWDIFGTQEVCTWQKPAYLGNDGRFGVVGRPCCTREEDPKGQTWGNYIYYKKSRFDVLDSGHFWLSQTPDKASKGWTEKQYRICNWGKFRDKKSGREFFFFTLHQGLTADARLEMAKLVRAKAEEIAGRDAAVIITGDFNATRDEASIAAVESGGFLSNSEKLSQTRPSGEKGTYVKANWNRALCDSSDPATVKLDYIFVSKPVKVLSCSVLADNQKGHYPSDHRPIMAVVKILK